MNDNLPLLSVRSSESLDLPTIENDKYGDEREWEDENRPRTRRLCCAILSRVLMHVLPWTITIALSVYILSTKTWGSNRFQQTMLFPSQMTYSPVESEIEYIVQTFDHNLVNSPVEFQDPETVDAAWADLYDGEHPP